MNPGFSLYLDLLRVLAACAVVLCHFGSRRISGGVLWQAAPYGAEAVDVFFVISGLVIAYAAARPGQTALGFLRARATRLYSVAMPALLLTFALDALGLRLNGPAYASFPGLSEAPSALLRQAFLGLSFLNASWLFPPPLGGSGEIGTNIPWWSLGYEAPYYLGFGIAFFGRGWARAAGLAGLALVLGPAVCAVAPAWLAGVLVWRVLARTQLGRPASLALALAPLFVWAGYEVWARQFGRAFVTHPLLRAETPQDLLVASCVALHLVGMNRFLARAPAWLPARDIRFAAARSFSLYLYHFPLLLCLRAGFLRAFPGASPLWMLPCMLACVLVLAQMTELQRGRLLQRTNSA